MGAANAGGEKSGGYSNPNLQVSANANPTAKEKISSFFSKTALGRVTTAVSNSEFAKKSNKKNRESFVGFKERTLNKKISNLQETITKQRAKGKVSRTLVSRLSSTQKELEQLNRTKDVLSSKTKSGVENYDLSRDYKRSLDSLGYQDFLNRNTPQDSPGDKGRPEEVIITKNVGGKQVQTTEAKVEEDKIDSSYDARKTKKKGRRSNLLTSARGVTRNSDDYSLGKKSLLGMV
jgi:hypothetical protein